MKTRRPLAIAAPLLAASVALGVCIAFNNGAYDLKAILVLFGGLVMLAACFFSEAKRPDAPDETTAAQIEPFLWAAVAFSLFWGWNDDGLIMYAHHPWSTGRSSMAYIALLLLTYVPGFFLKWREPKWISWGRWGLIVLLVIIAGVDTLKVSPKPWIDVWTVQQQGADALLHGHNPYTAVAAADTTPGRSGPTPYVYPPTQILAGEIGWILFRDVRYTMLLAMIISGVGMRLLTARGDTKWPPFFADAPSLFLFCTPKLFFILEQSWVDPVQLAFITSGVCLAAYDKRLAAIIVFGLAASSKQTLFWLVPLVGFMLRLTIREWIIMGASAALPVIPFAIWDFHALKYGNFDFLVHIPPRADALTIGNWMNRKFAMQTQGGAAFPLSGAIVAFACWKMRGPASLAVTLAFTYAVFFAFNKQAFANYYFFTAGLAALGAAAHLAKHDGVTTSIADAEKDSSDPPKLNSDDEKEASVAPERASTTA